MSLGKYTHERSDFIPTHFNAAHIPIQHTFFHVYDKNIITADGKQVTSLSYMEGQYLCFNKFVLLDLVLFLVVGFRHTEPLGLPASVNSF